MKKVAQAKKVKITGFDLLGEEIEYEFELMPANVGLPLFHVNMLAIAGFCQEMKPCIGSDVDSGDVSKAMMTAYHCLDEKTYDSLKDNLLKGYSNPEPIHFYASLYHALYANFGLTIPPLLEALAKQGKKEKTDDTSPDQVAEALAE